MMKLMNRQTRCVAAWCAFALHLHFVGAAAFGQNAPDCGYDRAKPSLASARQSYQLFFNFACAEQELHDLLKKGGQSQSEQAEAHGLLAIVYFLSSPGDPQRDNKVRKELKSAIRADADWTATGGQSVGAEFEALVAEARRQVAREDLESRPPEKRDTPVIADAARPKDSGGRSKLPWLIGGGVAVVGAIFLLAGGSGGGGGDDPLPGFPPHP